MITSISIENSTMCGANCKMCPREYFKYNKEEMPLDFFMDCIDQLKQYDIEELSIGGYGDPLLDRYFRERCEYVKKTLPNAKIVIGSTCQLLQGEMLDTVCEFVDQILISMYGMEESSYESVHRGSLKFKDVKKNIDDLLNRKDKPYTVMKYLVLPENEKDTDKWIKYYKGKCDRVDVWKPHNWGGWKRIDGGVCKRKKKCFRISRLNNLMIRTNGDVSICCMDYNHQLIIGNIKERPLSEIINGPKVKELKTMNDSGSIYDDEVCGKCDQLYDRSDALVYSDGNMDTNEKSLHIAYSDGKKDR